MLRSQSSPRVEMQLTNRSSLDAAPAADEIERGRVAIDLLLPTVAFAGAV
jgi:hypothetical protein